MNDWRIVLDGKSVPVLDVLIEVQRNTIDVSTFAGPAFLQGIERREVQVVVEHSSETKQALRDALMRGSSIALIGDGNQRWFRCTGMMEASSANNLGTIRVTGVLMSPGVEPEVAEPEVWVVSGEVPTALLTPRHVAIPRKPPKPKRVIEPEPAHRRAVRLTGKLTDD